MGDVTAFPIAANIRRSSASMKALLEDTADLLETIQGATDEHTQAARIQAEAIRELLTGGAKPD